MHLVVLFTIWLMLWLVLYLGLKNMHCLIPILWGSYLRALWFWSQS